MSDVDSRPLSDAERAELEMLRAEKARREQAERDRRERAELESLRAQSERVSRVEPAAPAGAKSEPEAKTFGQRMVTSGGTDEDGLPTMPPAQKLIIAICVLAAIGFVAYSLLR